jgi:site-specific recombinase XerD
MTIILLIATCRPSQASRKGVLMFKRSGVWWTCIRHNGKKIQKSLETADRKLAKAIEAKVRTEIVEGSYFEKLIGRNKTFKDMMDKFMFEHAPKVSVSTQSSYATSLKHLDPFFGKSNLLSISPKMVSRYKVLRNSEGAAPASVNRELSMLTKAFNLAVKEWEWLRDNPASKVPKDKENNERDRWLTKGEEKMILENSPEWVREIVVFLLNTGLRLEESLSLEWSRVNLLRRTILIRETKNGSPKILPLNKIALEVLNQRSRVKSLKNDLVFISCRGKKINRHYLRKCFYDVLKEVGIENLWLHDLRHTFATRLAQAGVDLYKISKLLGHKDIRMTQRYAHHCLDSLRSGVEILESDYNLTTVGEKEYSKSI